MSIIGRCYLRPNLWMSLSVGTAFDHHIRAPRPASAVQSSNPAAEGGAVSCPGCHRSNWIAMSEPLYPPSLIFYLKIIIYWLSWNLCAVKSKGVLISLEKTLQAPVIRSHFHCLLRFKSVVVGLDWFRVRQISPFVLPELIFSTTSGPFYLWMTFLPVIDMSKVGTKAFYIHG